MSAQVFLPEGLPIKEEYEHSYTTDEKSTENSTHSSLEGSHLKYNSEDIKIPKFKDYLEDNFGSIDIKLEKNLSTKCETQNEFMENTVSKNTSKLSLSSEFQPDKKPVSSTSFFEMKYFIKYISDSTQKNWPFLLTCLPCISFLFVPLIAYGTILVLAMLPIISIATCLFIAFLPLFWKRIESKIRFFNLSIGTVLAFSLITTPFLISICIPICFFSSLILLLVTPWILILVPAIMIFLLPLLFGITLFIGTLLMTLHYSIPEKIESQFHKLRYWRIF